VREASRRALLNHQTTRTLAPEGQHSLSRNVYVTYYGKIPASGESLCRAIALLIRKELAHDERKRKGKENRFNNPHP
jgi:hypothetical protein